MIKIPKTIEAASKSLDGLEQLLTARQWEKAAIVFAFTTGNSRLSFNEFAAIGIAGLKDPTTVSDYRKAWQAAIDDGHAVEVSPGDSVELPTIPWKSQSQTTKDVQQQSFRTILARPDAVREAIKDRPELAHRLAEVTLEIPTARRAIEHQISAEQHPIEPRESIPWSPPASPPDYRTNLVRAAGLISGLVHAIQRNEWTPTTTEQLLLHALGMLISQATPDSEPDASLFDDIDRYLAEGSHR